MKNNKKLIIITIGATVAILALSLVLQFLVIAPLTKSSVAFTLSQPNISVQVFQKDSSTTGSSRLATIDANKAIELAAGDYYYIASGPNIAPESVTFQVPRDLKVEVDPSYIDTYLGALLTGELPAINDMIQKTYPRVIADYTIQKGRLFEQAQWYAGTLLSKQSTVKNPTDPYRFVAFKENGLWRIAAAPAITLSHIDYPDIPVEILRNVNSLDPGLSPVLDRPPSND